MMSSRALRAATLACLLLAGCRQTGAPPAAAPAPTLSSRYANCRAVEDHSTRCDPSLTELLSRPEWYDGASVSVAGVLDPQREGFALFASEDAYKMYLARSGVLLELRPELRTMNFQPNSGGWAIVSGKYVARGRGEEGVFGGAIVDVTSIFPYRSSRVQVPSK